MREESAFQGGDGYLHFGSPELALATVARIAEHAFETVPAFVDPIYADADFAVDFFAICGSAMGELVEDPGYAALLGAFGPAEHAGLSADVAATADLLYACGPLMRHLYDRVPDRQRGAHAADSARLAPIVAAGVRPGDAVLVKGSLGSRRRLVVAALEGHAPGVLG